MPFFRVTTAAGMRHIRQAATVGKATTRAAHEFPDGVRAVEALGLRELSKLAADGWPLPVAVRAPVRAYSAAQAAKARAAQRRADEVEAARAERMAEQEAEREAKRLQKEEEREARRKERERAKRAAASAARRVAKKEAATVAPTGAEAMALQARSDGDFDRGATSATAPWDEAPGTDACREKGAPEGAPNASRLLDQLPGNSLVVVRGHAVALGNGRGCGGARQSLPDTTLGADFARLHFRPDSGH